MDPSRFRLGDRRERNNMEQTHGDIIRRIATLVAYDVDDDDIVARVAGDKASARWVRFMARCIRNGSYTVN